MERRGSYTAYCNMKRRVRYGASGKYLRYSGTSISPEWEDFEKFDEWYQKNYVLGWELDKDILVPGNRVYGPDTCLYVPRALNLILKSKLYPGAHYDKSRSRYMAYLDCGGRTYLGNYDSMEKAKEAVIRKKPGVLRAYILSMGLPEDLVEHALNHVDYFYGKHNQGSQS